MSDSRFTAQAVREASRDRCPDFSQLEAVLRGRLPDRPTLFEFFLNPDLEATLLPPDTPETDPLARRILAWRIAGYDHFTQPLNAFTFPAGERERQRSISMSHGGVIRNRDEFDRYDWPEVSTEPGDTFRAVETRLPEGMKIMVQGPGGVLENAVSLMGYEDLCVNAMEDETFTQAFFDAIGSRLLAYYQAALVQPTVGVIISNDDWGFKTQTMLSPAQMRRFVFPWHRRIVGAGHDAGRPVILHSCGNAADIWDDIKGDMRFDAKHSFEDAIEPIETAYDRHAGDITLLGGLDVDFMCRATPEQIFDRARAMLERSRTRGRYALGTGNSVPDYMPARNVYALWLAALAG